MNLLEIHNEAMRLLGYTNQDGIIDDISEERLLTIGNAVFADLQYKDEEFKRLLSVQQEIPLDDRVLTDCFVYGVAMWIAMQNFDGDNQAVFQSLYQQKKHNINRYSIVTDVWSGEK